jgi:hypothetical protein
MSTATIQSTSDGAQEPETTTSTVEIELLGCDSDFQSNPPAPGNTGCNSPPAGTPIPSVPIPAAAADAPAADYVPAAAYTRVAAAAPAAAQAAAGEPQELSDSPPEIPTQQQQQQQVRVVKVQPEKARQSSSKSSSSKMTAGQAATNMTVQSEHLVTVRRILAKDEVNQGEHCCSCFSVCCMQCSCCVCFCSASTG